MPGDDPTEQATGLPTPVAHDREPVPLTQLSVELQRLGGDGSPIEGRVSILPLKLDEFHIPGADHSNGVRWPMTPSD